MVTDSYARDFGVGLYRLIAMSFKSSAEQFWSKSKRAFQTS